MNGLENSGTRDSKAWTAPVPGLAEDESDEDVAKLTEIDVRMTPIFDRVPP